MMNFEQLKIFVDVAKEGSFDRVATENYTSQRTISRQMKNLERSTGLTLFIRQSNRIELTYVGQLFLKQVTTYLKEWNGTLNKLQKIEHQQSQALTLGYYSMFDGQLMRDEILTYQANSDNPPITFTTAEKNVEQILADLTTKSIDIGYINQYGQYDFGQRDQLKHLDIYSGKMTFWVSRDNPLAQQDALSEANLVDQPLLFYNNDKTNYFMDTFYSTLKSDHPDFHIKFYYSIEELMIDCSLNHGIAYLPDGLTQRFLRRDPHIKILPFHSENLSQDYRIQLLYHRDNHSQALKRFIRSVKQKLQL